MYTNFYIAYVAWLTQRVRDEHAFAYTQSERSLRNSNAWLEFAAKAQQQNFMSIVLASVATRA